MGRFKELIAGHFADSCADKLAGKKAGELNV